MRVDLISKLGPLAPLAGIWEGAEGRDEAPGADRALAVTRYRERITFEPFGPVDNHEQVIYGLKYATVAYKLGEADAFHEETGYWLWDAQTEQVMRCFIVPRGITVLAGGSVAPTARELSLTAELGSHTFGICSGPFLDREFRTERYELKVTVHADGSFTYEEDTQMRMPKRDALFHHRDSNTLRRVG